MNYKEFLDSFLQFEDENIMFQVEVSGIKIWHYIRQHIVEDLADQFGFGNSNLVSGFVQPKAVRQTYRDILRKKVSCNQFFAHRRDVLIFPNIGKYKDGDGYYRCIYTDLLDKAMIRSHYLLDGKSLRGVYEKQRSKNVLYMNREIFQKINKLKHNSKLIYKAEIDNKIIYPIQKYYNITVNTENKKKWLKIINFIMGERESYISYYQYILRKIKPKVIIVTSAHDWDKMILCEVAKNRKIPVIELQHGAIGRLHVAYNFLKKMNIPTSPDYLFTFGQFDKSRGRFAIADEHVIPVGFPELESYYQKYCKANHNAAKERKQILFISQLRIDIAQYAEAVANILDREKYQIIFKLHPREYGKGIKKYGGCLNHSNIEVVESDNRTIHDFLAEADWVVGSYSTTLFEATMFDVKIAIIDAGMSDYAEDLYSNGYAVLVDSPQKLAEEIIEDSFESNQVGNLSIFEKNSLTKMLKWIDRVIDENRSGK